MNRTLLCLAAAWLCLSSHELWAQTDEEIAQASVENPLDMTFKLVNPSFDNGDVKTGWEGEAFTTLGGKDNAQHLNKFYYTYQTVSGLPHGIYAVSVKAFYRPGPISEAYTRYRDRDNVYNAAKLVANTENSFNDVPLKCIFDGAQEKKQNRGTEASYRDTEEGVTKYVPSNLVAAEYYMHELDLYDNTLVIGFYEDELTIGVDKSWSWINNDWSAFDDFRLTYYGTGDEAAQLWRDYVLADYQANKEFREKASPVVKERYQAAFEALRTAATYDEVKACVEALVKAYQDWWDNAGMWESISNTLEDAETLANSGCFDDEACQTMLAVVAEAKAALAAMTMDNDELEPLFDRFWDAFNNMRNQPKEGADLTFMIKNSDFEDYSNYWNVSFTSSGNIGVAGTADNKCFEAWNCPNFDIHQYVYDLPLGVYEIQVQGFYRYLRDQASWNAYTAQKVNYVKPGGAPVYVYINDSKTPLMNIYDEKVPVGDIYVTDPSLLYPDNLPPFVDGEGCWYPNEMYNSALAFSQGLYTQSAYGIVTDPWNVQVGVTGKTNQAGDSWAIWDNFRLIYHGYKADVVKPVLENTVTEAQKLTGELMGRSEHAALVKAIEDATQAVAAAQGEAMFNALAALYTAMAQATDSKDIFMEYEVGEDINALAMAISEYDQKPSSKVLLEKARELLQGIAGCSIYETSQVGQIRSDISAMISDLFMTGDVYEQLGNALLQLSATLNTIDGAQNDDGLVIEARALYVDVLNNYTDGAYDRDTAEEKLNEVTQMMTRLKEMYLGIGGILADDCKVEFFTTDGRRLEKAQKGIMVMKITRSDGTVTIRKITTE